MILHIKKTFEYKFVTRKLTVLLQIKLQYKYLRFQKTILSVISFIKVKNQIMIISFSINDLLLK